MWGIFTDGSTDSQADKQASTLYAGAHPRLAASLACCFDLAALPLPAVSRLS